MKVMPLSHYVASSRHQSTPFSCCQTQTQHYKYKLTKNLLSPKECIPSCTIITCHTCQTKIMHTVKPPHNYISLITFLIVQPNTCTWSIFLNVVLKLNPRFRSLLIFILFFRIWLGKNFTFNKKIVVIRNL